MQLASGQQLRSTILKTMLHIATNAIENNMPLLLYELSRQRRATFGLNAYCDA